MAVTFKHNVVVITAGADQEIASGDQSIGGSPTLRLMGLRWVTTAAPTQGDNCQLIDDSSGTVLWEAVAPSTAQVNLETIFPNGFDFKAADLTGLRATVDSGTLYLYLGGGGRTGL